MEYRNYGNTYYIRMDRGDEIFGRILSLCKKEKIRSAVYSGIGGIGVAESQIFQPETGTFALERIEGTLELVSLMGNVVCDENGEYYHHSHALLFYLEGTNQKSVGGHMKSLTVSYTAEIELRPVLGGEIQRTYDPETGTGFWHFPDRLFLNNKEAP